MAILEGAVVVDKPSGLTSHDCVATARRALGTSRIGHTGTLDPLATGVLVLLVGRATRLSQFLVLDEKEYIADVRLGLATPTYDAEGIGANSRVPTPNAQEDAPTPSPQRTLGVGNWQSGIDAVLDEFRGTFLQTPPPYSAKKVQGRRAYERARNQQVVELKPVEVTVRELERLPSPEPGVVRLRVVVSSGFYVRSLAHDIGQRLGCGAHLSALRRTRVGQFGLEAAVPLDRLAEGAFRLLDLNELLAQVPPVTLTEDGARRAAHGNALSPGDIEGNAAAAVPAPLVRLLDASGTLVAVASRGPDALLHPQVVLV